MNGCYFQRRSDAVGFTRSDRSALRGGIAECRYEKSGRRYTLGTSKPAATGAERKSKGCQKNHQFTV